jgi:hypothetical protein
MPAQSKSQQRFFGVVKAMQKGDIPKKGKAGKIAKSMSKDDVDDFASTKHKGKPEKVKREQRVRELIKKMVREELGKMNEVRIPFSSSHIKQLKRAFKDMKGTLPDNNPLVQKIVQLLKGQDKKVLQQLANADIKYLSDKAKDILGEGTCGYGENGELGEEPAGPHLIKKKKIKEGKLQQAMKQWKYLEKTLTPHKKKFIKKRLKSLKPKMDKYFKNKDYQDYIDGELSIKVPLPDLMFGKGKEFGQLISAYSNAIKEPEYYKFDEGKLTEAKDTIFDVAARVLKNKSMENYKSKKGMVKLDMQTANLLTQVFKKINPKMKKILSDLGEKNPAQLVATLQAVVK